MPVATLVRRAIIGSVLVGWLLGSGLLVWLMLWVANERLASTPRDVAIEVPAGVTGDARLAQMASLLAQAKTIERPGAFVFYLRVMNVLPTLRTGWVVGNRGLSMREQLTRIARGYGVSSVDVVIPEGFTRFDVATRLSRYGVADRAALLSAMSQPALLAELQIPGDSAEGYLFPALYRFLQDSPPDKVVARMVATFQTRVKPLFSERDPAAQPLSPLSTDQLVTLASIIEREARVDEERPVIAGVFFNRLFDPAFKPKRLQADPTVAYGCLVAGERVPSCREFDGRHVTPAMVRDPENPYSTYRHEGLPPGPICNPGLASLRAALHPEPHSFFYFVAKGGGRHSFAASLEQHNQNVRPGEPDASSR
ncbi:MAG: hypothetical protein JWN04_6314 [Myxococcaceae bacterium]|nr:hypothetical protein [Myxococcaceae bacterium]